MKLSPKHRRAGGIRTPGLRPGSRAGGPASSNEYKQGFMIALLIVEAGTLTEIALGGRGVPLPSWPVNVLAGTAFLLLLLILHFFYRHTGIIKTLSRVPSAVSAIVLFTLLVLMMGLTKQNRPDALLISKLIGLDHIRNSFTFMLSGIYLMTTLGLVTLRRMTPLTSKNMGFVLNHAGLWIIIFAGSLGSGDIQRLQIAVNEDQTTEYAYNYDYIPVRLPFMVKLIDFSIDEYPPKLAVMDRDNMSFAGEQVSNMPEINEGLETKAGGWKISVLKFIQNAKKDSTGYSFSDDTITCTAALVRAVNAENSMTVTDWISCGNYLTPPQYVYLDDGPVLAMTVPEPREYSSEVEVTGRSGKRIKEQILVNRPVKIDGWHLYQVSYDASLGKYSKTSVMEAMKDPWLPVIYIGIAMVIAGALYIFWIGRTPKIH